MTKSWREGGTREEMAILYVALMIKRNRVTNEGNIVWTEFEVELTCTSLTYLELPLWLVLDENGIYLMVIIPTHTAQCSYNIQSERSMTLKNNYKSQVLTVYLTCTSLTTTVCASEGWRLCAFHTISTHTCGGHLLSLYCCQHQSCWQTPSCHLAWKDQGYKCEGGAGKRGEG